MIQSEWFARPLMTTRPKATEKKAMREWYKLDSESCSLLANLMLIFSLDTKQQPLMPVNTELYTLLQLVQNSTDPWLLFLYVKHAYLRFAHRVR